MSGAEQPHRTLDSTGLKRLHREWRRRPVPRLALGLDAVSGPFNVGAIVRTAAALRVDHVWLVGDGPAPDAERVGKTALGTHRYLTWGRLSDPDELVPAVVDAGFSPVAVELATGAVPLHELDLAQDVCLVVGHEERGVRPAVLASCDAVGYIPQMGKVGSLNVATAASIALYEARRQQWTTPSDSKGIDREP